MKQAQQMYKTTAKLTEERLQELLRIKREQNLTAEAVIKAAKKKTNPLHELFIWDDTKAAMMYRLQQARVLINEVKIIIEHKEYFAFENVKVQVDELTAQRVYMERSEILSDALMREQIIRQAYQALKYWENKYKDYQVFSPVFGAIANMEKQGILEVG